jgi:hypothetical protein
MLYGFKNRSVQAKRIPAVALLQVTAQFSGSSKRQLSQLARYSSLVTQSFEGLSSCGLDLQDVADLEVQHHAEAPTRVYL